MGKQSIVFWMAILSILLYSGHWVARWYDLPQARYLKIAALFPFVAGLIVYFLMWREQQNRKP